MMESKIVSEDESSADRAHSCFRHPRRHAISRSERGDGQHAHVGDIRRKINRDQRRRPQASMRAGDCAQPFDFPATKLTQFQPS